MPNPFRMVFASSTNVSYVMDCWQKAVRVSSRCASTSIVIYITKINAIGKNVATEDDKDIGDSIGIYVGVDDEIHVNHSVSRNPGH